MDYGLLVASLFEITMTHVPWRSQKGTCPVVRRTVFGCIYYGIPEVL